MTLSEFSAKLEELIINDQLQDALKLLKNFSKSSPDLHLTSAEKNTLIDLIQNTQGRISSLERQQRMGTVKGDDYRVEMNSIRQNVLDIQNVIDEVARGEKSAALQQTPAAALPHQPINIASSQTDGILKIVILVFAGLCGVAFLVFLFMEDDMLEGAALSFTGVAGSIYGYMRFRIMETTLQFVQQAPADVDSAALSAALNKNILQIRK